MNWLRDTLKKNRTFVLAFLLVETFYWAEGLQFVYAHEIREQEREVHFQRLSELLGIPVEKLRGERWLLFGPLEELAEDVSSSVGVALDDLSSTLRLQARRAKSEVSRLTSRLDELLEPPDATPVASAEPAAFLGSPQEAEKPESTRLRTIPRATAPTQDTPRERTGRASRSEPKALPLRQMERKARTEKAVGTARSVHSSAVAPASTPRRVIPKDAVAPEIAALAQSLGNSPADIFSFVHDKIDFDPKWGAEKSPLGTLYERQGTSWDQAWLLQQLLTAAGVDARLEWGEVEISVEMLRNITGVEDPWRAGDLMTTAGTPIVLLVEGSQVKAARMSHVWVKAFLDFFPNRGLTPGPGDNWIRMDPSLKHFAIAGDLRLDAAVPYDLGEYLQSGTELSPRQLYEAALDTYVTANHPEVSSLEELKRTKSVVEEAFPFVPGTLRGEVVSVAGESVEVPEGFQQKLKLEVREAGGPVLATYETLWPAVYGQRLELAWLGATSSDQATLDLYGGVFSTPPFEVDLKPSIRVEGVEVAVGSAIGSAEDVVVQATWTTPQGLETVVPFEMWAGEPGVLSVDFGQTPQETIDRYTQELSAATDPAEQEAWSLALAGVLYQRSLGGDLGHLADLRWQRVLDLGRTVLAVQRGAVSVSSDGTPLTFSRGPVALDLGSMPLGLFPAEGGEVSTVPMLELFGSQGSFLEGEALAKVLEGDHVTGVTFLTRAVRDGQTLTRVDVTNVDEAFGAVELSVEAEASVRAGVEDGWIAWIPEGQLLVDTFDATGYVLEDPATGAAGYFVTYERLVQGLDANIVFHSPQDLDVVTAPTGVVATIESEALDSWTLAYQMVGQGPAVVLATGTGSVTEAALAQFDPTLLLNGLYDIVLTGRDIAGQSVSGKISVVVEGNLKIGHFTLSYVDLAIPFSGLDIEVVRNYDTRQRLTKGDFGQGWTLDIRQGSYSNNRPPGDGWEFQAGFLPCDTIRERKNHLTTVRLSDQEVYRFALRLESGAPTLGGCFAQASFEYIDGPLPGSTLTILGSTEVFYANESDRVVYPSSQELYVPENVRLRTRDGRIFHLNLKTGVTHLEDLNANTLEITAAGITHSSGRGIEFVRDDEDRITQILDPLGRSMSYTYDAAGDLVAFTDRVAATTRFTYDDDHLMLDIEDARGVNPVRCEYDSEGRLVRHIDAFGKATEISHDLASRQEIVTDRLGHSRVVEYDARGNVTRETDALGNVTLRAFDGRDNLLSETDPLGRVKTFTYSTQGDLETFTDPQGDTTSFTYNDLGQVLTVTAPNGGVTRNGYDSRGNLTQRIDTLGNVALFTSDASGNLLSMTDASGVVMTFEYDAFGNRVKEIDTLGHETVASYNAAGDRLTVTSTRTLADGSTETLLTSGVYDGLDRLTTAVAADGTTTSTTYDLLGKVTRRTDALGRVMTFEYDLKGRLVKTSYPDGTVSNREYDDESRLTALIDRAGRTTSYFYDPAGRLLGTIFPDGSSTSNTYDGSSQLLTVTDTRGNTTSFLYDTAGRQKAVIDALGGTTTFAYDANGNRTAVTDAQGQTTAYTYDTLDRLIAVTYPDGTTAAVTYDEASRLLSETDQAGFVTEFRYDEVGRLKSVKDALGQVTAFAYDEIGNLISQTDANGNTARFEHDPLGRLTRRVLPDGEYESTTYNTDGTISSRTDPNGALITFAYDANGQLLSQAYPDGSKVSFTYTAAGRRATVTNSRGTTSYTYDDRDRLTQKTDPNGYQLSYAYDSEGNCTQLTATVGVEVFNTSYTYDALNRPATVTDSQGHVTALSYDLNGTRSSLKFPNGVTTSYTYDALNRLVSLHSATSVGDVLQSYQLTLGPAGDRTRIDEDDGTSRHYQYDALYRLTQEKVTGSDDLPIYQRDFTYDAVGNRLTQAVDEGSGPVSSTSAFDVRNRLLSTEFTTYAWDANGNLTTETDAGETLYGWDFENRLTTVQLADGTLVETSYDVDGNRVRSAVTLPDDSIVAVDYLVDTTGYLDHVVAETVGGSVETVYTRVNDELIGLYRPISGSQLYYHADALGSIRLLSDESGAVTDRYTYSAFGELLEHVGADLQPYQFAGEPFNSIIGLYFNRARWLDVEAGRFIGADPFPGVASDPLSLHRYLYAKQDPVNIVDPTGKFGVASFSVANSIRGMLSSIQIDVGMSILTLPPLDPDGDISKIMIIASLAAGGYALLKNWRSLLRAFKSIGKGIGKAARSVFKRLYGWARRADMSWPNGIPPSTGLEMAGDLRQALNLQPMERSVAVAEVRVSGRKDLIYSVSGLDSPPGTAPMPTNRRYTPRNTRGYMTTANDSEVKILAQLAEELPPNAEGRISLYTERQPCASCSWPDPPGIIQQFEKDFPGIKIEPTWTYPRN